MAKDFSPSTHPLTPPLTEEVWLDWLRLLRSRRVGVTTFFRLMGEYSDAGACLNALPEIAKDAGADNYQPCSLAQATDEWNAAKRAGASPVAIGSPEYPELLSQISDPPPLLWCLGDPTLLNKPTVGLVGARNASSLGTRMARKLAAELGEAGFSVVSGLARGIDTAAHIASVETGTVAVMAGGVDVAYPTENAVLAQEIQEKGAVISEAPMHKAPHSRHFPRRNRIISGMAQAVVIVEAAAKSGSLITARNALDQGKEVLAVPGHPFDARASGCNMLIRDGAALVRSAKDVIEVLSREEPTELKRPEPTKFSEITDLHNQILNRLGPSPISEDQLIRDLNSNAGQVSPGIAELELQGKIRREAGGLLALIT